MGVSSAALTRQRRRQKDQWFEAGWASKSLTEQKYEERREKPPSDHLEFPLLHPELETLNVQMNESFLGERLSQGFLSSV